MRPIFLFLLLAMAASPAFARIVYARNNWAAIDRGERCDALSRAERIAPRGKVQAVAGFTFTSDRRRWGEFHARLRRMPRQGATVLLRVGGQPFLLVSRGAWAWSEGPMQDRAILAALRGATAMTIESRDLAGRRFSDRYLLAGAATAVDAAAAACAGKMQRR